jgi:hypothetical protein
LILSREETAEVPGLACTVEDPDMTIAVASRERLELAADAQVMSQAVDVDMAETIGGEEPDRLSRNPRFAHSRSEVVSVIRTTVRIVFEQEFDHTTFGNC